jgi:hypothetical protein
MPASSIEEKIRALLRLANDAGASEHEASLAMERAHALLLKHNLDMVEVEAGADGETQTVVNEEFDYKYANRWRPSLTNIVAQHNYCRVIATGRTMRVIGRPHNVAATKAMSLWLMGQVADLTHERWGIEALVLDQVDEGTWEQDWKDGFAFGIITRLKERLAEQKAFEEGRDSNVRALVVDLGAENNNFVKQAYPGGLVNRTVRFNGAAYNVGVTAADGVSISPEGRQVGGERKRLT